MTTKKPLKILCIDDEPLLLSSLQSILASEEFIVLTAENADAGLEIIRRESSRLAVVLSDFHMPGKNGFELRKEMLAEFRQIPFISVSGNVSREDALKAVELKISAFVDKPFTSKELRRVVAEESKARVESLREDEELLTGFLVDAQGLLDEMEVLVLSLEDNHGDTDAINRIFACAHTIKGASGFFKPDTVHRFAHRYEDFLSAFKKAPETLNPTAISVLLKGIDRIRTLLGPLEQGMAPNETLEQLCELFHRPAETAALPQAAATTAKALPADGESAHKNKAAEDIRVSLALLNDFMEKSGEITVLRNMVNKVLRVMETREVPDPNVNMLSELMGEMHKVVSSMQEQLGDLRKVPIRQVIKPLTRTLRDLNVSLKKRINLEVDGEDLRVDHTLAELFGKCLIHMLRNSADHGVEGPEERVAKGKTAEGTIRIRCEEKGDRILLTIADDGRGIDADRVRSIAAKKGVITAEEGARLSDAEARMLIFEPGFSTAEQVTDVSGRGVGTDMVRTTILEADGQLRLHSVPGSGTTFEIELPVPRSVLIINSLMVRIRGQVFAIPQENIVRVIQLSKELRARSIQQGAGKDYFRNEGELIPFVDFAQGLHLDGQLQESEKTLLWLRSKSGAYCFEVDEILDAEEIVVKRLGSWFTGLKGYAGATFLGDGRVGLVISVDGMAELLGLDQRPPAPKAAELAEEKPKLCSLLFRVGTAAPFALPQTSVYRLEEVRKTDLADIGGKTVFLYRGQAVPLVSLEAFTNAGYPDRDLFSVIMVRENDRLLGLAVDSVGDFVEHEPEDEPLSYAEGSQTCLVGGQVVTLLNAGDLFRRLHRAPAEAAQTA